MQSVSGPGYWGLMNPQWNMCSKGRRQSPINVEPDKLLFDPYLRHIHLDKHKVSDALFLISPYLTLLINELAASETSEKVRTNVKK